MERDAVLSDLQHRVLGAMALGASSCPMLSTALSKPRPQIQHSLNALYRRSLVSLDGNADEYVLTARGRRALTVKTPTTRGA